MSPFIMKTERWHLVGSSIALAAWCGVLAYLALAA